MKKEILVNPNYSQFKDFIEQIPDNFDTLGVPLRLKRNEIRLVEVNGVSLVIKYFRHLTIANRFIYAHIRKSKSRRAYEHTMFLLSKEISSPEAVAYINYYKNGMLYKSFYVCLHTNYKSIREFLKLPLSESKEALEAFARFSYKLHKNGIFHKDYSTGNILYQLSGNSYDFCLIDNNRMKFCRYSFLKGMRNMKRLDIQSECMGIIAAEYARVANVNEIKTLNAMTIYRLQHMDRKSLKKKIKSLKKLMPGK